MILSKSMDRYSKFCLFSRVIRWSIFKNSRLLPGQYDIKASYAAKVAERSGSLLWVILSNQSFFTFSSSSYEAIMHEDPLYQY